MHHIIVAVAIRRYAEAGVVGDAGIRCAAAIAAAAARTWVCWRCRYCRTITDVIIGRIIRLANQTVVIRMWTIACVCEGANIQNQNMNDELLPSEDTHHMFHFDMNQCMATEYFRVMNLCCKPFGH